MLRATLLVARFLLLAIMAIVVSLAYVITACLGAIIAVLAAGSASLFPASESPESDGRGGPR